MINVKYKGSNISFPDGTSEDDIASAMDQFDGIEPQGDVTPIPNKDSFLSRASARTTAAENYMPGTPLGELRKTAAGVETLMDAVGSAGKWGIGKLPGGVRDAAGSVGNAVKKGIGTGLNTVANAVWTPEEKQEAGRLVGKGVEALAAFKKAHPVATQAAQDALTVSGVVPAGKGAHVIEKGAKTLLNEAATRKLSIGALDALKDKAKGIVTGKLTAGQEAANAAAQRAGLPLSVAQKYASEATNQPTGLIGVIDRVSSKIPMGRTVQEKHKSALNSAVQGSLEKMQGAPLGVENIAKAGDAIKSGIEGRIKKYEKQLGDFYSKIATVGGSEKMVGGNSAADRAIDALGEEFNLYKKVKGKGGETTTMPVRDEITGVPDNVARDVHRYVDKLRNIDNINQNSLKVFRDMKQEIGAKSQEYYAKMDGPTANTAERALMKIYGVMNDAERAHYKKVGGPEMVDTFDKLNAVFSQNVEARKLAKAAIGYGKEIGEHGAKTSGEVVKNLIDSKKITIIPKLIPFLDEPTVEAIRAGVLARFVQEGHNVADNTFSMAKLEKNLAKYKEDTERYAAFKAIVGEDTANRLDDLVKGGKRAGASVIRLADSSNPSGTATAMGEYVSVAGAGAGLGTMFLNPVLGAKIITGVAATNYAANITQRLLTGKGLNKLEKGTLRAARNAGIGAALGITASELTGTDDTEGAMVGAGLGAGYGIGKSAMKMLSGIAARGRGGAALEDFAKSRKPGSDDIGPTVKSMLSNNRGTVGAAENPQIRTDNFKKWFGDWEKAPEQASKVVDDGGKPLVVFHGTKYTGDILDPKHFGEGTLVRSEKNQAISFTSSPEIAGMYAHSSRNVNLLPEYNALSKEYNITKKKLDKIRHVAELSNDPTKKAVAWGNNEIKKKLDEILHKLNKITIELDSPGPENIKPVFLDMKNPYIVNKKGKVSTNRELVKYAKDNGYDGLIVKNTRDFGGDAAHNNYFVFNSNQIKSATGNSGAFSAETNEIRGNSGVKTMAGIAGAGAGLSALAAMARSRNKERK